MNGSVFKRCSGCGTTVREQSCRKCGSTSISWADSVRIGRNAAGRWQQRLRSGFRTKREAQHALLEVTSSLQSNTYVAPSKLSVGRFLTEEWLPATAPPQVRYETWNDRRRNLTTHVVPHVGSVIL